MAINNQVNLNVIIGSFPFTKTYHDNLDYLHFQNIVKV